jgi:peptidoglycan-associated lipoprotein
MTSGARALLIAGALGLAGTAGGCATVKPEELDSRLAQLRQEVLNEVREGDQANASALTATNRRVDAIDTRVDALETRVDALEQDVAALRRDLDASVEALETSLRFSIPVHFEFDRAEIRAEDRPHLDRFAAVVTRYYPDATITVEGFADPAGDDAYNVRLAERRAEVVRAYLVGSTGLASDRVRTVGYGESPARLVRPDAHGPGERGVENRRVVLVVDYVPRDGATSPQVTALSER